MKSVAGALLSHRFHKSSFNKNPEMAAEEKPYRKGVGVVLLNDAGKVFVAQRIDTKEPAWQMPQGGIDKDEAPYAAALRELEEETGTAKAELIAATEDWLRYDLPADLQTKMWKGKYRGQEQMWYLMRFTGADSDINIETEHPEFSEWKWADFETLPDLIVGFKKDLYRQIVAAFARVVR
jgi:putative (di)nucleoside polyphosphate hydrolase